MAWRNRYTKPGLGDKVTAFFFRLIPKFGSLDAFQFHAPTPETEKLFADSLKATVEDYRLELLMPQSIRFDPPNMDLDTGRPTHPGEYLYCDRTYAKLLDKLEKTHFANVTPALRDNVLGFYADGTHNSIRKHRREWRKVQRELAELKAASRQAIGAGIAGGRSQSRPRRSDRWFHPTP